MYYLIEWKDFDILEATWEPRENIQAESTIVSLALIVLLGISKFKHIR